jgi:hypothetical protein
MWIRREEGKISCSQEVSDLVKNNHNTGQCYNRSAHEERAPNHSGFLEAFLKEVMTGLRF